MGFVDCKGEARKHLKRPFFSFQESILGMHIRLVGWKWGEGIIKISQWSGIWTTTSYIAASPVNSFQRLENYSSPMKFCKLTSSAHLADVISYSSKLPSSKLFSFSCSVAQSCPALYDLMDCSPPGSNVHGISLQARILEWVVISSSRESSDPGIEPTSPALASGFFTIWATRKAQLQEPRKPLDPGSCICF